MTSYFIALKPPTPSTVQVRFCFERGRMQRWGDRALCCGAAIWIVPGECNKMAAPYIWMEVHSCCLTEHVLSSLMTYAWEYSYQSDFELSVWAYFCRSAAFGARGFSALLFWLSASSLCPFPAFSLTYRARPQSLDAMVMAVIFLHDGRSHKPWPRISCLAERNTWVKKYPRPSFPHCLSLEIHWCWKLPNAQGACSLRYH